MTTRDASLNFTAATAIPQSSGAFDDPIEYWRTSSSATVAMPALGTRPQQVTSRQMTAEIVADAIIDLCNEHGDLITNLKLQKLLYYAQAWYLALYDTALFPDRFEAWVHGPIQPGVFAKFFRFSHRPIEQDASNWGVPKRVAKHIVDVLEAYGATTAFDLERLSCQEQPWIIARQGKAIDEPSTTVITTDAMRDFYRARLNEQKKQQNSARKTKR